MAPDDAIGDEGGDVGVLVAAMLDVVERLRPDLQASLVLAVPLGHARVEVPAVVIEARSVGDLLDVCERHVLEDAKPDDDVGHLDAGVVDVVLDLDGMPLKRSTRTSVSPSAEFAEMPDVSGLVRVDGRVLDDGLAGVAIGGEGAGARRDRGEMRALEEEIEISVGRSRYLTYAFERPERGGDFLAIARGALRRPAGQLERGRRAEVARDPDSAGTPARATAETRARVGRVWRSPG